jgi:hypothetical protein
LLALTELILKFNICVVDARVAQVVRASDS